MGIKIGNIDASYYKIGSSDCTIYLGTTKLYPQSSPTHDYNQDYFTFVALDSSTFTVKGGDINYSLDSGITWSTLSDGSSTTTITSGNMVMWKGSYSGSTSTGGTVHFTSSGHFNAQGNTMSLLYGDDFKDKTSLGSSIWTFNSLFSGATGLVSAENMKLPATTATQRCYNNIFSGCTSLSTPPEFPATTLEDACYQGMFKNCTSFHNVPTDLFSSATVMGIRCYTNTFWESGIKNVPLLNSTSLAIQCYSGLFAGCTGLTTIPSNYLPATTIENNCYYAMFSGCTSLDTVPSDLLPATTLKTRCYTAMFKGCTSLVTAPNLPAMTVASSGCYNQLFDGCSKLNYIKAMFTTTPSSTYMNNWVRGVASTGTYVMNSSASYTTRGNSAIPNNWTIQKASS